MKTVDFSESIEVCDLKVGIYRQLNDLMKIHVSIEGQCHFLTLAQVRVRTKSKT